MELMQYIEDRFARISELARRDGVEAELLVEAGESLKLSVNEGKVEKFDASQSQVGGLRVILDGVEGYSWTESLEEDDLESAYAEALQNAKFAIRGGPVAAAECVTLYSGAEVKEDPSLFNDSQVKFTIEEKIERAKAIEREAKAIDPRIVNVPYNGYAESRGEVLVMNTKGVRARQRSSGVYCFAYCLAKQGDEARSAAESSFTRSADRVPILETARDAALQTIEKLGAISPATGEYPIIIRNDVAAHFFALFKNYFSAKAVAEKTSLFANDRGQQIASSLLTISDEPSLKDGIGNRVFDAEGAPTAKIEVIKNGRLENFLTNTVYAHRLGLPHTASAERSARGVLDIGFSNFVIGAGKDDFTALLKRYPKVIVITSFQGYHSGFNEGSGDFSLSAEGELWENGAKVKPLNGFVVSGSVKALLKDIEMVSNRLCKIKSSDIAPDLLIRSLAVAGSA